MTSDFWLNKLRQSAPPPPAPQAGFTAQGTPWWAHPTYGPAPPAPASAAPVQGAAEVYRTDKAQSARATERCPSCGSDEYWRATPNMRPTCNACHYPVQNSTQGMAIANRDAPGRPALFQPKGAGYRPDVIVGHV